MRPQRHISQGLKAGVVLLPSPFSCACKERHENESRCRKERREVREAPFSFNGAITAAYYTKLHLPSEALSFFRRCKAAARCKLVTLAKGDNSRALLSSVIVCNLLFAWMMYDRYKIRKWMRYQNLGNRIWHKKIAPKMYTRESRECLAGRVFGFFLCLIFL